MTHKLIGCVQHDCDQCKRTAQRIAELEAENAALREDAERYRWMSRSASWMWVRENLWNPISVAEFDAAIDAARGKK